MPSTSSGMGYQRILAPDIILLLSPTNSSVLKLDQAWPASVQSLAEWAIGRATGKSPMKFQGNVKPETITGMLSALRSVHVDRQYPLTPFESPWLKRLINGKGSGWFMMEKPY